MPTQAIELASTSLELVSDQATQLTAIATGVLGLVAAFKEDALRMRQMIVAIVSLALSAVVGFLVIGKAASLLSTAAVSAARGGKSEADIALALSIYTRSGRSFLQWLSISQAALLLLGLVFLFCAAIIHARATDPRPSTTPRPLVRVAGVASAKRRRATRRSVRATRAH